MPRARRRKTSDHKQTPGWAWMLSGLGLGLGAALIVYLGIPTRESARNNIPHRTSASGSQAGTSAGDSRAAGSSKISDAKADAQENAPTASATKNKTNRADGTQFDFYTILPKYEVVVPGPPQDTATPSPNPNQSPSPGAASVRAPGDYILQAGSFRSHDEADRMKASLALLGIESTIHKVRVNDQEYNRVRIGPIDDPNRMNRIRTQLRKAGIKPLVINAAD